MKCKNCGAKIRSGASVCPNCGANNGDGYYLSNENYSYTDYSASADKAAKKKRGNNILVSILVFILVFLIAGGVYYYFAFVAKDDTTPELNFQYGTGIINDDQPVVYVTFNDSSRVQYIHAVRLYEGDISAYSMESKEPVAADYEYTKDISDAFRAVFFYTDELKLKKSEQYTYTFEIVLSNYDDAKFYTYRQPVVFKGDIKGDVDDVIFDHSMDEDLPDGSDIVIPATTQQDDTQDYSFIYDGYWFSDITIKGNKKTIKCLKFTDKYNIVMTEYTRTGNGDWKQTGLNSFQFRVEGEYIMVKVDGQTGESAIKIDYDNKILRRMKGEKLYVEYEYIHRDYSSPSQFS